MVACCKLHIMHLSSPYDFIEVLLTLPMSGMGIPSILSPIVICTCVIHTSMLCTVCSYPPPL